MKPRLYYRDGRWICYTNAFWYAGFGDSPVKAYKDWKWANQMMK